MKLIVIVLSLFCLSPLLAQEQTTTTENPMVQLKDELKRVLAEANAPFTEEQERAIVLMMEERRKASEDLFGDLQNFSDGPTRGQDADRLNSAIEWMRNEFLTKLQDYLRPEQLTIWSRYRETAAAAAAPRGGQVVQPRQNQTQYVRINNNPFTSEDGSYGANRGGGAAPATEVIQRGGAGDWHGVGQFLLKDDNLNAGRRFARNKPPYQERQISLNVSGPLVPGRLTTTFAFSQNEAKNSDVIRATLADGSIFSLGVTKPTTVRTFSAGNTLQLSESTSVGFTGSYSTTGRENQGIGGFVMPERAFSQTQDTWNFEVKQFSALSARRLYETRFNVSGNHDATTPATQGIQYNVSDAFSIGGAQNHVENTGRTYEFSNLYTQLGEKLTLKTGLSGAHRGNESISENNFGGIFTFSGLENYRQGKPVNYRISRGNPNLEFTQWEFAFFAQNDVKVTSRLTVMAGARYEVQTNLHDHNNFDPRMGFAYALGNSTVIRGGAGIFHQRLAFATIENQIRRDGSEHQYELTVNAPSYPDPFQGGTIVPPSIRVFDPHLVNAYNSVTQLSYEHTFSGNLFTSISWDRNRETHRPRPRNLNAPMDITSPVPASCKVGQSKDACVRPQPDKGNIISMESTGTSINQSWRFNVRKRFSILNLSANYTYSRTFLDASGNYGSPQTFAGYGTDGLGSDNYNLKGDWARITTPAHTLNTTANAQLPFGIFLTNTMALRARGRYTITTGRDDNQDTSVNDRPLGVGRNGALSPTSLTFNFNVSKAFFFGGASSVGGTRQNMNVFANITNAFNRPNYLQPSGVMSSPNFGKSTSAEDPREIEVGLRYQF